MAVAGFFQPLRRTFDAVVVQPAVTPADLFQTGDFKALALLDGLHEHAGLDQAIVGAGVQPGKAASKQFDGQCAILQIHLVDGGDFQLAALGWLDPFGILRHLAIVEIETGDRPVRLRLLRLLFQRQRAKVVIKLHHAKALRIHHLIAKNRRPFRAGSHAAQLRAKALAEENIVA